MSYTFWYNYAECIYDRSISTFEYLFSWSSQLSTGSHYHLQYMHLVYCVIIRTKFIYFSNFKLIIRHKNGLLVSQGIYKHIPGRHGIRIQSFLYKKFWNKFLISKNTFASWYLSWYSRWFSSEYHSWSTLYY